MLVNQRDEPIVEEELFLWMGQATDSDRDTAIRLLCEHLGVSIFSTNATKHGNVNIELRINSKDSDESDE